jgi:hypothetical protein
VAQLPVLTDVGNEDVLDGGAAEVNSMVEISEVVLVVEEVVELVDPPAKVNVVDPWNGDGH